MAVFDDDRNGDNGYTGHAEADGSDRDFVVACVFADSFGCRHSDSGFLGDADRGCTWKAG